MLLRLTAPGRRAGVHHRHRRAVPGDPCAGGTFEERYGITIEVLDASRPDGPGVDREHCCSASTRSPRSTGRSPGSTAGSPDCAGSRPPTRGETPKLRRDERREVCGRPTRWPTGPRRTSGVHPRARPALQRPARRRATHRSAARRAPCRARAARAAGRVPTRPSAGCTSSRQPTMTSPARGRQLHATCALALESEAIHIMREVAAEFERPVLLFSGGKDSIVLLRLAEKAFRPAPLPVPADARRHGPQLPGGDRVPRPAGRRTRRAADRRLGPGLDRQRPRRSRRRGPRASRNRLQTVDAAGRDRRARLRRGLRRRPPRRGARPRQGARSSPSATTSASGTRKRQRPELWNLYNGRIRQGEHVAGVPDLELDRARRLGVHRREELEVPSIYFAHEREVFRRDGMLYAWRRGHRADRGRGGRSPRRCATGPSAT